MMAGSSGASNIDRAVKLVGAAREALEAEEAAASALKPKVLPSALLFLAAG